MKIHSLENTGSISVDGVDIISLNPNGTIQIGTQTVFTAASYEEATATGGTITNQTIGNQIINGDLIVTGSLTAQQFIVSSSVTYLTTSFASGSTKFGDTLDDVHGFTGSLSISGSFIINGASYNTTTSGTSGSGGTSGSSGSSGTNGTAGTGGTSGTNGTDGTGGTSGTNGTAGTGGTSGADGSSGATGSSGSGGTSGTGGTDGTGGTSGTSGGSGSSGATGSSGSAGTSGTSGTATTSTRVEENFIATANQTTFTVTGGYTVGLVDVFVNGVRFLPTEYTATNGTTIVFDAGLMVNDEVTVLNYTSVITALPTSRNVQDFTATSGQTTFTVTNGYIVGLLDVFVNGSKLTSSEFTATNGTTFVLTVASTVGDQVQSINYTASVNGVSGAGTTNELAYYTASSTLSSLTTSTYPSLTELSYVKGVTSVIQTQLNAKAATLSGTTNNLAKFTSSSAIGNSILYDNGTLIGINTTFSGYTTPSLLVNNNAGVSIPLQAIADTTGGRLFRFYTSDFNNTSTGTSFRLNFGAATGNTSANLQVYTGGEQVVTGTTLALQPSGGNVGIGTSSPDFLLHTLKSSTNYIAIDNSSNNYRLLFGAETSATAFYSRNYSTNAAIDMRFVVGTSEAMRITSDGTVQIKGVGANSNSLIVYYGGSAQSAFQFSQGSSNAILQGFTAAGGQAYNFHTAGFSYINNGANFAIGNTSDLGYRLDIGGTFKAESKFSGYNTDGLFNANSRPSEIVTPSGAGRIRFGYNDYGAGQYYGRIGFYGPTNWSLGHIGSAGNDFSIGVDYRGAALYLYSNSNYSFAGSNVSDSRKKANINYITSNQLDTILKLKPASFNQKDSEGNINSNTHTGFIAQDVLEENIPNLVHGSDEDGYGLDYYGVLALAVKAIQELSAKVTLLENN